MDFNLKEQKKIFGDAWAAGDKETALTAAQAILENAPESVYGYYYKLVIETANFTTLENAGEDFDATFENFCLRSKPETADKYRAIVAGLKTPPKTEKEAAPEKPAKKESVKERFSKLYAGLLAGLCVILAALVIIPSAIYSARGATTFYQAEKWDNGSSDAVIFELTLNKYKPEGTEKDARIKSVWVNVGSIDNTATEGSVAIKAAMSSSKFSSYSTSSSYSNTCNVENKKSNVGKWVRVLDITSDTSRRYVKISTKDGVKYNEVVFLDINGNKIKAEVLYAGPDMSDLTEMNESGIYNYRLKSAKKLLDEQDKFKTSRVLDGGAVYDNEYDGLNELEAVTLESARNMLTGGAFADTTVNPFGLQLIAVGVGIFGGNAVGLRIMPLLFTIGTLIMLYYFGKMLFGKYAYGFAFAALYFLSGFAVSGAAVGSVNAIFVFFAVAAFYFMVKFIKTCVSKKTNYLYYLPLVLSGAFYALAVSVKMQALYALVALGGLFALAAVRQRSALKAEGEAYVRKRNFTLTAFLATFVLLAVVWTGLTYLFSFNVYKSTYSGGSLGYFLGQVFSMPRRAVNTGYSASNASNVFAHLLGFKAERLSGSQWFFSNTVVAALSLFSVIFVTAEIIYAYASKSAEVKTASFKKNVLLPYIVLGSALLINLLLSLINVNTAISESVLTGVFYTGFIILAFKMLGGEKNMYVQIAFGVVLLFALVVLGFGITRYLGIPVESYPFPIGAYRW